LSFYLNNQFGRPSTPTPSITPRNQRNSKKKSKAPAKRNSKEGESNQGGRDKRSWGKICIHFLKISKKPQINKTYTVSKELKKNRKLQQKELAEREIVTKEGEKQPRTEGNPKKSKALAKREREEIMGGNLYTLF
jgi:hypothetical protein